MLEPLHLSSSAAERAEQYSKLLGRLELLLQGEDDWVACMATVACELHHAFEYFHWTGFYRAAPGQVLVVGPYQGSIGCLRIPFARGVCGSAALTRQTHFVPDVHSFEGHIACASSTQAEVVVPIVGTDGQLLAVLDIDSDHPAAFMAEDKQGLERLCAWLGSKPWRGVS